MRKIVFLEGLPGVGKTTILNEIRKKNLPDVYVVDEVINKNILENQVFSEVEFLRNDSLKVNQYSDGVIVIDRGPISSLSYAQTKNIMDVSCDISATLEEFPNYIDLLNESKVVYLTNRGKDYSITSSDIRSPYSSIESQKILEEISIYNSLKYCENTVILDYFKENMEEVIHEIIN